MSRVPRPPSHISALVPAALLALAAPTLAQQPPPTWSVGPSAALVQFSAAAAEGGGGTTVARPSRGTSTGIEIGRVTGPIVLILNAEHMATRIELADQAVTVQAHTPTLSRTRLALGARLLVARLGEARLSLGAGPTLDIWSPDGSDARSRTGAAAQLVLAMRAGPVTFENALAGSISASPFEPADLPDGYARRTMRALAVSISARFGL